MYASFTCTARGCWPPHSLAGLTGLVTRREVFHHWPAALGRTGIVLWVTYLPLSLLAMESNWNDLFLAEPRFRPKSPQCLTRPYKIPPYLEAIMQM